MSWVLKMFSRFMVFLVVMLLSLGDSVAAEQPISLSIQYQAGHLKDAYQIAVPQIDAQTQLRKSLEESNKAAPVRFAIPTVVEITPKNHGEWTPVVGGQLWRLGISAPGATDTNFGFEKFYLPDGAQFQFVGHSKTYGDYVAGPYTNADRMPDGQFWSPPVPGGDITLELFVPEESTGRFQIELIQVASGFRDLFKRAGGPGFAKQGACNNDVVCPEGDPWRDQIRSVAAYTVGGTDTCTGTLIMDAESSFTPYFLTAFHCGLDAGNAGSVVTIWNYESAMCGDLSGGSRMQTVSGATFRASRQDVDMALIELASTPPDEFNVFWSGWDRTDVAPSGSVGIHHPNVDEKAISFNTDTLTKVSSCIVGGTVDTHWQVNNWEDGTTEPGSSGSGIWDPNNQLLVGFLSGGSAACGNNLEDCYGRFGVAWTGGSSDAQRLQPWLDPNNTGVDTVIGSGGLFEITAMPSSEAVCQGSDASFDLTIEGDAGFTEAITLALDQTPAGASAGFGMNPVMVGDTSTLLISNTGSANAGDYVLEVTGTAASGASSVTMDLVINGQLASAPTLQQPINTAGDVSLSPQFQWTNDPDAVSYQIQVATDASFTNVVIDSNVSTNLFQAMTALERDTTYFWRVRAINGCGESEWSMVFSFLTVNEFCVSPAIAIPDNSAEGLNSDFVVNEAQNVNDLNMAITIDHTYVGDLALRLTHVESGRTALLVDRPGLPDIGTFGCDGDNIDATFDDEGTQAAEDTCSTEPSEDAITGNVIPTEAMSVFDGFPLSGTWRLSVSDNANLDTGTLISWCLEPELEPIGTAPAITSDSFQIIGMPQANQIVGQVIATDVDDDILASGGYSIIAGDDDNAFSIDDVGVLRVAQPSLINSDFSLTIQVEDETGLTDSAIFLITLETDAIFKDGYEVQ